MHPISKIASLELPYRPYEIITRGASRLVRLGWFIHIILLDTVEGSSLLIGHSMITAFASFANVDMVFYRELRIWSTYSVDRQGLLRFCRGRFSPGWRMDGTKCNCFVEQLFLELAGDSAINSTWKWHLTSLQNSDKDSSIPNDEQMTNNTTISRLDSYKRWNVESRNTT